MLKTLSKSLQKYKRTSVIAVLLTITEVVFEIIIPSCMAYLIDFEIEAGAMQAAFKYGVALGKEFNRCVRGYKKARQNRYVLAGFHTKAPAVDIAGKIYGEPIKTASLSANTDCESFFKGSQ